MFDAVKDKALLLMEFDQHLLEKENNKPTKMPAVQLLVKNTDAIPVSPPFHIYHALSNSSFIACQSGQAITTTPSIPAYLFGCTI